MNVPGDVINIIFKHYQFAEMGIYKFFLYFRHGGAVVNTNDLFSGHQALPDFNFRQFLCILHQLGVAFLPFIFAGLLKKMLQVAAVQRFLIFFQPDIKYIFQYPFRQINKTGTNGIKHLVKKIGDMGRFAEP